MQEKICLKSMTVSELQQLLGELGQPKYRAGQIFRWLHLGVTDFDQMSDIGKPLRQALAERTFITVPQILVKQESKLDGTIKYLFGLPDGNSIESVLMQYEHGTSICLSTQAGCKMGCVFCASFEKGRTRNLTPAEILDQVIFAQKESGRRISNIVLMGTGEPLDNFDNVMRFLELVSCEGGLNIGMRHISLSTCGLVPKIKELEQRDMQLTLSISLHAPNDAIRDKLMPVNKAYPLKQLIPACRQYFKATGRRISFEYAMIRDVNDTDECARELTNLLKGFMCHVNLIPLNHVEGSPLIPSTKERVRKFQQTLLNNHINATVRRTLGGDIDASCGQLRRKIQKEGAV